MTPIPDDIMKTALEAVSKKEGWLDSALGVEAIARAIMAEREANAQLLDAVAEQFWADAEAEQNPLKVPAIKSVSFALSSAASAIRKGEGE